MLGEAAEPPPFVASRARSAGRVAHIRRADYGAARPRANRRPTIAKLAEPSSRATNASSAAASGSVAARDRRKPRHVAQPRLVEMADVRTTCCAVADRHRIAVDDRQRIAGQVHVEPRQRAPRAADQIERQPLARAPSSRCPEAVARPALAARAARDADLRDAQHAEREGDALVHLAAANADQFEAAAAEIADDAVRIRERPRARPRRAISPPRSPDSTSTSRPSRGGSSEEIRAVRAHRAPRRWRRCGACHVHLAGDQRKRSSATSARSDGRRIDQLGRGHAPAEPGHHLLVEQDRGNSRRPVIDDETDRIRADVDDRRRARRSCPGPGRVRFGREIRASCRRRSVAGNLGPAKTDRTGAMPGSSIMHRRAGASAWAPLPLAQRRAASRQRRIGHEIAMQVERLVARPDAAHSCRRASASSSARVSIRLATIT